MEKVNPKEPSKDEKKLAEEALKAGSQAVPDENQEAEEYEPEEVVFEDVDDLEYEKEELQDQIESEEEELPPPKEVNEAKQLNVGNIMAVSFIFIAVVLLFIMMLGLGKKQNLDSSELDKAGLKSNYDFNQPMQQPQIVVVQDGYTLEPNGMVSADVSELDAIRNAQPDYTTLSSQYQLPQTSQQQRQSGTAPAGVSSVGSTNSAEKPDTRNSRSPRKVDGIKGLNYDSSNSDVNKIANAMTYGTYSNSNQNPNKDAYIQEQLTRINNQNNTNAFGATKNEFYSNNVGNADSGKFLNTNTLWDGTIISGVLITAINTDNPGVVMARVSENVYSSLDHSFLLIPEGTVLYGEYNYDVSYGQASVQVGWNLLIRPDGYRLQLGNFSGVNSQGASGYNGSVSNHPFATLKAMGLIAVFSMLETEASIDMANQTNQYLQNATADVYKQAQEIENKILDRALDIKPTIKVKEGTEIKLITNIPLELPPCKIPEVNQKYVRTK